MCIFLARLLLCKASVDIDFAKSNFKMSQI